jgi:hypothetical protein
MSAGFRRGKPVVISNEILIEDVLPRGDAYEGGYDMSAAIRQNLHTLVDMVEDEGLETLYNVMIRFIPEDDALPDEAEAHITAVEEYRRGETVSHDDINWT